MKKQKNNPMHKSAKSLFYLVVLVICGCSSLTAQEWVGTGEWRSHVPFRESTGIITIGEFHYLSSSAGLWTYNYETGAIDSYTKAEGLHGVNITAMDYHPASGKLVLAYADGKLDIFKDGRATYLPQIFNADILGEKTIRSVRVYGQKAYLSASFGAVVLDLNQNAVENSVRFSDSPNFAQATCFDMAVWNGYIWFGLSQGLYRIPQQANLKNLTLWEQVTAFPNREVVSLMVWNNQLLVVQAGTQSGTYEVWQWDQTTPTLFPTPHTRNIHRLKTVNNQLFVVSDSTVMQFNSANQLVLHYTLGIGPYTDATLTPSGEAYFSSSFRGLVKESGPSWVFTYGPNRPFTSGAYQVRFQSDGTLWVLPGALSPLFVPAFRYGECYRRRNEVWETFFAPNNPQLVPNDFVTMAEDPTANDKIVVGSAGTGVYTLENGNYTDIIQGNHLEANGSGRFFVGGLDYDRQGNLWIGLGFVNNALYRKGTDQTYTAYTFPGFAGVNNLVRDVVVDNSGRVWMAVLGRGIAILDPATGNRRYLTNQFNFGDLPDLTIRTMHKDKNGEIWVGTNEGLRVFSTGNIMTAATVNGQRIVIRAEDGNNELLLGSTIINDIRSDGGNRKWIATQGAGVRLVSPDGRTILRSFTAENSPLLSNNVQSVAIDPILGDVYFATDAGLCSYRGDATEGDSRFGEVTVFPNPVRETYSGLITITGLARDADVRITDVSGHLVYQTQANGGTATWNGRRYDGRRPQTGVYLVFCTNEEGTESMVTKLLFIR